MSVPEDFTIIFGPPGVDKVRARIAAEAESLSITVEEAWLREVTAILQSISVCQPGQARSTLDEVYSELLRRAVHIEKPFVTRSLFGGQYLPAVIFYTANITVDGKPFEFELNTDEEKRAMAAPLNWLLRPEWIRGFVFRGDVP